MLSNRQSRTGVGRKRQEAQGRGPHNWGPTLQALEEGRAPRRFRRLQEREAGSPGMGTAQGQQGDGEQSRVPLRPPRLSLVPSPAGVSGCRGEPSCWRDGWLSARLPLPRRKELREPVQTRVRAAGRGGHAQPLGLVLLLVLALTDPSGFLLLRLPVPSAAASSPLLWLLPLEQGPRPSFLASPCPQGSCLFGVPEFSDRPSY